MTDTRYARSGGAHIAYQVLGDGPVDVLMSSYINISVDAFERESHLARFMERLASFARVIRFDTRGVGLSDPVTADDPPTLEQRVTDALAVLDDAGSERAALFVPFTSGPMGIVLAATHPERTRGLVLCNSFARLTQGPDYPWGQPPSFFIKSVEGFVDESNEAPPGLPDDLATAHAYSLAGDHGFRDWWLQEGRRGASPATAGILTKLYLLADVREVLGSIRVPTLVSSPAENQHLGLSDHGRYLAEHIPGAKHILIPGSDVFPFSQGADTILDEMEEMLTGERRAREPDRVLASILFTDIVGSTERAAEIGDRAWRELLDRHDAMVRRQIDRYGGREVKTTGDGFMVTFTGPTPAVRCAIAVRDGAGQLGMAVRAGVHTGEVEVRAQDIGGIAVHLAQRVASMAGPDEVFSSRTVKDLVFGSGIEFEDRGQHELKGVPGRWHVFSVTG